MYATWQLAVTLSLFRPSWSTPWIRLNHRQLVYTCTSITVILSLSCVQCQTIWYNLISCLKITCLFMSLSAFLSYLSSEQSSICFEIKVKRQYFQNALSLSSPCRRPLASQEGHVRRLSSIYKKLRSSSIFTFKIITFKLG